MAVLASTPTRAGEPVRVVTSIPPLAMIVSQIGGDRVAVRSILAPGADPHTFEPRPSDATAVTRARVVVSFGSAIDDWLGDVLAAPAGAIVVRLDAPKDADDHGHDDGHSHHGENDPHVWLDPVWVRLNAVGPIQRALAEADPDGAPHYGVAARAMSEQLLDLESDVRESFLLATTRNFLSWHPAWNHFAERFGLHAVGGIGESEGREPSLRAMVAAVRAARAAGVRAVLVEPQSGTREASVLADELGVPLVTVDPLGSGPAFERSTYDSLIRFNVAAFERALDVRKPEDAAAKAP